ncbi:MAG: hypothetical protein ACOH2K_07320 [Burkholderiaceae bacterium]
MTQPFSKLIREQTDIHALRQQAASGGMNPLHIAGALKIIEGASTAEEVLKVTSSIAI